MSPEAKVVCLIMLILILTLSGNLTITSKQAVSYNSCNSYNSIVDGLNFSRVIQHIKYLSSLGSRVTGYPGFYQASKYIETEFKEMGLDVEVQNYSVAVPIDNGSVVEVHFSNGSSRSISAYSLWPNQIQTCKTPEEGISGRLVYVGHGTYNELQGKELNGSIILMDFDSGSNWLEVTKFGAKGIVFIPPESSEQISYSEISSKFLLIPLYLPRLYVPNKEDVQVLKEVATKGYYVTLRNNMLYESINASNVIGVVKGTQLPDEVIVVAAHFDSWSVVPAISPGADEATAIASLIELARYYSIHKPPRTMWFVALSGHYQALAGAREFVEHYYFRKDVQSDQLKLLLFIGLDYSTDEKTLGVLYAGNFYENYGTITANRWNWISYQIYNVYIPRIQSSLKYNFSFDDGLFGGSGWWAGVPRPFILDSEPVAMAHALSLSLKTSRSYRNTWGSPFDIFSSVNLANLEPQVVLSACLIESFVTETQWGITWSAIKPLRNIYSQLDLAGFMTVIGRVMVYNYTTSWYNPVNKSALVYISRNSPTYSLYPFTHIVVITNDKGEFEVHGLGPSIVVGPYFFESYIVNEKTGQIEYAPDLGQYGAKNIPFSYSITAHPYNVTTVVFKSVSLVFTDIFDLTGMRKLTYYDPRFESAYSTWSSSNYAISVFDQETWSEPIHWGQCYLPAESDFLVFFLQPKEKYYVRLQVGTPPATQGFLANSSEVNPNGIGFQAPEEGQEIVTFTLLKFARDVIQTTKGRLDLLKKSFIKNPVAEEAIARGETYYSNALNALDEKDYKIAYGSAIAALSWASKAYSESMNTIMDSAKVNVFFAFIAIPFSIILEMLLFEKAGRKRFLYIVMISLSIFGIFYIIHPSAKLGSMWMFTPIGVALILVFLLVLGIFFTELSNIARITQYKLLGKHVMERGSPISISFSYGVRNIKKRKFRSVLTMITVTITTFGLVSFSSLVNATNITVASKPESTASYQGMLIKRPIGVAPYRLDPIDNRILNLLEVYKMNYKDIVVVPRAWLYPESISARQVSADVKSKTSNYGFSALLGLTNEEVRIFNYSSLLIKGRWFNNNEELVCIMTSRVAESLNVSVDDFVEWEGIKLKVIGILNSSEISKLDLRDLDNYPITPVNPNIIASILMGAIRTENEAWSPMSWDSILIVPFNIALRRGGFISSISIQGNNLTEIESIAKDVAVTSNSLEVYVSNGKKVSTYSSFNFYAFQGTITVILMVIGLLTVMNSVLASVKERQNEINVYAAVGVSPKDIGQIFVAEELVYALVGATIGYLSGVITNAVLISTKSLPPAYILNSSSSYILISLIGTMFGIVLASLYPLWLASRFLTPSFERKWKLTTKPVGDSWDVPLPFLFDTHQEATGLLNYLMEYFRGHTVETVEVFVVREIKREGDVLSVVVSLKPVDAGILQRVTFQINEKEGKYEININIQRLSGVRDSWISNNYQFVDAVRKQFLIWRGLRSSERNKYLSLSSGDVDE